MPLYNLRQTLTFSMISLTVRSFVLIIFPPWSPLTDALLFCWLLVVSPTPPTFGFISRLFLNSYIFLYFSSAFLYFLKSSDSFCSQAALCSLISEDGSAATYSAAGSAAISTSFGSTIASTGACWIKLTFPLLVSSFSLTYVVSLRIWLLSKSVVFSPLVLSCNSWSRSNSSIFLLKAINSEKQDVS